MEKKGFFDPISGHWEYLGFGFSLFSYIFAFSYTSWVSDYGWLTLLVFFACSLFGCISSHLLPKNKKIGKYRTIIVVFTLGTCWFGGILLITVTEPASQIVGLGLLGFGSALLWGAWTCAMVPLSERNIIGSVLFSVVIVGFLAATLSIFHLNSIICSLLFILVGAVLYIKISEPDEELQKDTLPDVLGYQPIVYSPKLVVSACALLFAVLFCVEFVSRTIFLVSPNASVLRFVSDLVAALILMSMFVLYDRVGVLSVCRIAFPLSISALFLAEIAPASFAPYLLALWEIPLRISAPFLTIVLIRLAGLSRTPKNIVALLGVLVCIVADCSAVALATVVNAAFTETTLTLIQGGVVIALMVVLAVFVLPSRWYVGVDQVLSSLDADSSHLEKFAETYGLTAREAEVLYQVIEGKSETEIAESLFVGKGTVHSHIVHIYKKADVHNRSELLDLLVQGL